ncbi:hypothetical protein CCASP_06330 [Corynebacterium caspium DSM 44850]|nr:hypothetical protein CCASP_06330 [Corynebacterium caspium DSM 44850]
MQLFPSPRQQWGQNRVIGLPAIVVDALREEIRDKLPKAWWEVTRNRCMEADDD